MLECLVRLYVGVAVEAALLSPLESRIVFHVEIFSWIYLPLVIRKRTEIVVRISVFRITQTKNFWQSEIPTKLDWLTQNQSNSKWIKYFFSIKMSRCCQAKSNFAVKHKKKKKYELTQDFEEMANGNAIFTEHNIIQLRVVLACCFYAHRNNMKTTWK